MLFKVLTRFLNFSMIDFKMKTKQIIKRTAYIDNSLSLTNNYMFKLSYLYMIILLEKMKPWVWALYVKLSHS